MCGRYTLVNLAQLTDLFPWITEPPVPIAPRYNIAPSQPILAVANDKPDAFTHFLWGLIPSWAKDPKIGAQMCNARAETVAEKNSFKNAYRRRRCLIPADGFYEWRTNADEKTKQPFYVRQKIARPFAFAGLWEIWSDDGGNEVRSATIVTTRPNELMTQIHARMPVILHARDFRRWLDPKEHVAGDFHDLLEPYPAELMEAYPVAKTVNNVRNDGPDLLKPVEPERTTLFG
jgi:putative SOS response-associated peptidase YedK